MQNHKKAIEVSVQGGREMQMEPRWEWAYAMNHLCISNIWQISESENLTLKFESTIRIVEQHLSQGSELDGVGNADIEMSQPGTEINRRIFKSTVIRATLY